jgi:hypothetical protein
MGIDPQTYEQQSAFNQEQIQNPRESSQEHFHQPSHLLEGSGLPPTSPHPDQFVAPQNQGETPYGQVPFDSSFLPHHSHNLDPVGNLPSSHVQEPFLSEFDLDTTTSLHTSWFESQDKYPPSTAWSEQYPRNLSSSHRWESHSFPEQPLPSEVQDHTHENTALSHLEQTLQNTLTYPVTFIDENNHHSTLEYPIGGGNPNSSYAFIDMHNHTNPLYFTNNRMDQRYTSPERYILLSHTEGAVRLYTPQNAYNYIAEQRNQRSQISQIASNTTENSQSSELLNERTIQKTGKTRHQLENERTIQKTGKTIYQLVNERTIQKTGKTLSEIKGLAKTLKTSGKTVANTLALLKQLEQALTQQKTLSNFTRQNDGTISINGRQAQLYNVPGRGMNCLLYAMLAADGHNIDTPQTHQIVANTRTFLQTIGRAQADDLLEMDTATSQGAEALAYLRSMGHLDHNRGITIHATWQNPQDHQTYIVRQDVIPSQNGASPIELYLNLHENHYNYIKYLD